MKFHHPSADIFVPDNLPTEQALARTTHLGIGAHQDDLEFMCLHGILACFQNADQWFTGVTVTDGRGSSRANEYAGYTDDQMVAVRRVEQRKAAFVGEYGAALQLNYPSREVKDPHSRHVIEDLKRILLATSPEAVYTHNLADKHETHIGVAIPVIQAIRELPAAQRPKAVYGCEVWRNLDWMLDDEKVVFDVGARENISNSLMGVFDSQISGGKRYDLATAGRKRANATYFASHATDQARLLEFAMDLTPLVVDPSLSVTSYGRSFIDRFADDVASRLTKRIG